MGKIYKSITELVGHTPLVELGNYEKKHNLKARLLGKLEYFNPSGSIKDRAALNMIEEAEKAGLLKEGQTIVDNTSGNTGIHLQHSDMQRVMNLLHSLRMVYQKKE